MSAQSYPPFSLRLETPADREFFFRVYAGTREDELAQVDWDDAQKQAFLRMQFEAQDRYYRENYPGYEFQVIQVGDQPAGRLYLHRRPDEIRIMDIALLPDYRRQGIGTRVLRALQAEAQDRALPVTIHVERFNPALRLYERLGFQFVEDRGVYWFLRWTPAGKTDDHRSNPPPG
jgi:ribosomal protein S18 acetylase RimI-like enzyme